MHSTRCFVIGLWRKSVRASRLLTEDSPAWCMCSVHRQSCRVWSFTNVRFRNFLLNLKYGLMPIVMSSSLPLRRLEASWQWRNAGNETVSDHILALKIWRFNDMHKLSWASPQCFCIYYIMKLHGRTTWSCSCRDRLYFVLQVRLYFTRIYSKVWDVLG